MGKLIQTYAVVCVTIDDETGLTVEMELSDASEMPMDDGEVWDTEAGEWVSPDHIESIVEEANDVTAMAIQALKNATRAQKEVARWEVCGRPLDDGYLSRQGESIDAQGKGAAWQFKDGSILLVTHEGIPVEAR